MELFNLLGEVIKIPISVAKDVVNLPNKGSEKTNTGQRFKNIKEDFSDIFE